MKVIFSEIAKHELEDAETYYELEMQDLGARFKQEVKASIKRILQYPEAWPIDGREIRKCIMKMFPYKIFYSIENDHIFIIALAHQHRKPDCWVDKITKK
jgi:plasmid stabilization system protein ParE